MTEEEKNHMHYLEWFWINTDFGLADRCVRDYMNNLYEQCTNKKVPKDYEQDEKDDFKCT